MKLSYAQLRSNDFANGMMRLASHQFKSPKFGYNVAKIHEAVKAESATAAELFTKLVDQYALKSDDGKLVPLEGTHGTYQIPAERQGAWKPKIDEFLALTFEIKRPPLEASDLEREEIHLSALEIAALGPLLAGFE